MRVGNIAAVEQMKLCMVIVKVRGQCAGKQAYAVDQQYSGRWIADVETLAPEPRLDAQTRPEGAERDIESATN